MRKRNNLISAALCLCTMCVLAIPAGAMEYSFDAPADYLFAQATSDSTIYEWENPNVDRSKSVAVIAPGFGTPTSYLPYSEEYLTPNQAVSQQSSAGVAVIGSTVTIAPPDAGTITSTSVGISAAPPAAAGTVSAVTVGFTEVTQDWFYPNGSLGSVSFLSQLWTTT